jgi:hypothetical protein
VSDDTATPPATAAQPATVITTQVIRSGKAA